jgi:hypothetical protein
MAASGVSAIFEGAFEEEGVRIRVDVLERLPEGGWGLREVKSSTGVKEVHLEDVSIQQFVLERSGVHISSVQLLHVNRNYIRGEEEIEWSEFFQAADVTSESTRRLSEVPERLEALSVLLGEQAEPDISPGRRCFNPYSCEFWDYCTARKPDDWVFHLPSLTAERLRTLQALGIEQMSRIPEDFDLSDLQRRVWQAHRSGHPYVSPELEAALDGFGPPAFYLDFETLSPAIPPYPGTRPYHTIPFQWSLHYVDSSGKRTHRRFLTEGRGDPRPSFVASLVDALAGTRDPILVYSSFESARLTELAEEYPESGAELDQIRGRLCDLLPVVRAHIYLPQFRGSYSLKAVAPALATGVTFDDLEAVADGRTAAAAMAKLSLGHLEPEEETEIRRALLAYCERDTLALVELHEALRQHARDRVNSRDAPS